MAEATLHEPEWLAARRERAASLRGTLDLPRFKGAAGWEFTSLDKLDLDAFGPAPADAEIALPEPLFEPPEPIGLIQVDGAAEVRAESVPEGVTVCTLAEAIRATPTS